MLLLLDVFLCSILHHISHAIYMYIHSIVFGTVILTFFNILMKMLLLLYTIRESVDSLCRDGTDMDTPINQMKRLRTPECYIYKPFQTHKLYECFSSI